MTALTQRARGWWERPGLHLFDPNEPEQLDLYLLTSEIARRYGVRGSQR